MNTKNDTMGIVAGDVASERNNGNSNMKSTILAALAVWLGIVLYLGSQGVFAARPGSPPLPIFLGYAVPIAIFLTAYFGWGAFRVFILGADLRIVTAMQAWRWAGQHFLYVYALGALPGLFAIPVGLGDMAIGITAPWMVLGLIRNRSFAAERRFAIWNILGIIDFIAGLALGILCSGLFPAISQFNGHITTGAMARLPMVLTPAFIIPFFTMLHLTALFQARMLARLGTHR